MGRIEIRMDENARMEVWQEERPNLTFGRTIGYPCSTTGRPASQNER
jgi:hypothetical protein